MNSRYEWVHESGQESALYGRKGEKSKIFGTSINYSHEKSCGFSFSLYLCRRNERSADMETITFSPAQVHVFNLVSHIKSAIALEQLREQLALFYAKQVDDEMDQLWESGQFDEKRMKELRGSHFRTHYNK